MSWSWYGDKGVLDDFKGKGCDFMVYWHKTHKLCNFPSRVGHLITLNWPTCTWNLYPGGCLGGDLTGTIGKHFKVLRCGFPNPGHYKYPQRFEILKSQTSNLQNQCWKYRLRYCTDCPGLSLQLVGHGRFKVWQESHAAFVTITC